MMNSKTTLRLAALVVGLLFVLSVGASYVHSHSGSADQSCTLCQAPHLPESLTSVPANSCQVLRQTALAPSETDWTAEALSPSLSYRGPPALTSIS